MSYISKIIGKRFFALSATDDATPVAAPLEQYSRGLSSVLDGMRSSGILTEAWAARCRKEHGERVEARQELNGKE